MSWRLFNGNIDFVTIHDDCPDKLCDLIMSVYLDFLSESFAEPDCEDDLNDL